MEKRYKVQEVVYGSAKGWSKDDDFMFDSSPAHQEDDEFFHKINHNILLRYLRWKRNGKPKRITETAKFKRLGARFGLSTAMVRTVVNKLNKEYTPRSVSYTFSRKASDIRDAIIYRKYKELNGMSHNKKCIIIANEIYVALSTVRRSVERSGMDLSPSYVKKKSKRNEQIIKRFAELNHIRFKDARYKVLSSEFSMPVGTIRSIIINHLRDGKDNHRRTNQEVQATIENRDYSHKE